MNDDQVFRFILIAGFLVIIPVGLYHRVKSQTTREKLDRRQEGIFILVSLRLLGLAGWIGLLMYMIDPSWIAWSSVLLPIWLRWVGVALMMVAGSPAIWTFRHLGKNITDTVVTRAEHSLVTTGPYRWVRHPFYVAAGTGFIAVSLMTANWFLAVIGCLAFILLVVRTRKEEEKLVQRFGDEYREYMQKTGRFVPRISRLEGTMRQGESAVMQKVNLVDKLALFTDHWKPKIVGELNGQQVKLAKFQGPFVWHHHENEDEMFLVVKGRFRMEFRDRHVWLEEGEFLVVPRGVEHRPVAEEEAHVLLFEPASTLNTGNVQNERTLERLERI
jgi:protein-S-isoprenylcysteine O-methyltransferase Ste14/mannose-6-phosphate isomerase-like protein (cupin superfamily)